MKCHRNDNMKWYMDKKYMEDHISAYVKFQLKQGYRIKDIKNALLKYGYDKNLVNEICKNINLKQYKPTKIKKVKLKELNEDLYIYLQNLLVDYIIKEQNQGYTIDVIKKALINYGHHPSMVKKAILAAKKGSFSTFQSNLKLSPEFTLAISLILIVVFTLFLTYITDESLYLVFLSFLPAIAMILINFSIIINTSSKRFVQLLPIISVAGIVFIFVGLLQISPIMRSLSEPGTILLLNVFLGFILCSFISLFSKIKPKKISVEDIQNLIPEYENTIKDDKENNDVIHKEKIHNEYKKPKIIKAKPVKTQRIELKEI